MKIGIVCEGGGMRGIFTAGVLQAFMNNSFIADELVGVSAGASNGISYVSNQSERAMRTNIDYVGNKDYFSIRNYFKTRSLFGMDYLFATIPDTLDPFDYEAFYASSCDFFAGATNIHTGKITYFGKKDIEKDFIALRASCSIPMLSPIVDFKGSQYLDGGVAAPIPIDKAVADGCDKIIVILTRSRGYLKKPQSLRRAYHMAFQKYPQLIHAMDTRHIVYNQTLEQIAELEKSGIVLVVSPPHPLTVDRFGQDKEKLAQAYQEGLTQGNHVLHLL